MDSPEVIVVAVMVSCSVPPPPVRVAVTVIEYSVPSSRPVSVCVLTLPAIVIGVVLESSKQSVLVLEKEMVKVVAVKFSSRSQETVTESVVDEVTNTVSPAGEK